MGNLAWNTNTLAALLHTPGLTRHMNVEKRVSKGSGYIRLYKKTAGYFILITSKSLYEKILTLRCPSSRNFMSGLLLWDGLVPFVKCLQR